MAKAKKKKKAKTKKGVTSKTTGKGVIETWLVAFSKKELKTAAQVTEFMKKQFPNRASEIFNHPNVVVGRANRGLLTHGKIPNPKFKKYPVDNKQQKK